MDSLANGHFPSEAAPGIMLAKLEGILKPKGSRLMNVTMTERGVAAPQPLEGKVSLITGSTSGIGLGIARALAAAGSAVILNGFGKPEEIEAAQAVISELGVPSPIRARTCPNPKRLPR